MNCINTAGAQHSATCDDTFRSRNDIEPSTSRADASSRPTVTLALALVLSPLPLVPRVLVIMLTTFATLAYGAPGTSSLASPDISLTPSTHCRFVLALTTSTLLTLSNADEQRLPQRLPHLPCVTIHVYDPADHFHTVYTVNPAHPGFASDPSDLVYGDSDSEAALFHSVYGTGDYESDSATSHGPNVAQHNHEHPSSHGGPSAQSVGNLAHASTSPSGDTPAYTSFLHGLLTHVQHDTDSESDDPPVPDSQSLHDVEPEPDPIPGALQHGADSESDDPPVPESQSLDDAEPEPDPIPELRFGCCESTCDRHTQSISGHPTWCCLVCMDTDGQRHNGECDEAQANGAFGNFQATHPNHMSQRDEEDSTGHDTCNNDDDLHDETDSCADMSDGGNPLIDYPTCANYNCNRPSNQPGVTGALCCHQCQPIPHSAHTTSCHRAWIEEMLLDLEHTAVRSRAEPAIIRTSTARYLAWTTTSTILLALSPLPPLCNVLAIVLAYLTPLVCAAPTRPPTPPGFDINADSGQGSGGGTQSDSRCDRRGAHTTPSATVTTAATTVPQSDDAAPPAATTLLDMLTAGSDGFLAPYDGAQTPCEMPDCPYVASIVAGDFMALCCYDCALYHAHSCSRTRFPADNQPAHSGGLLTAAQTAGITRYPDQSASNAEVCDIAAAIAASLADLQIADAAPEDQRDHDAPTIQSSLSTAVGSTHQPHAPRAATPALWDDSSAPNVSDSTSLHVAHLRTLSSARAERSDIATTDVASRTSLTPAERRDALHRYRINSDATLLGTSADTVIKLDAFIAQATESLLHLQQRYADQCTPDNAAALDVARIALTHGLTAVHGILPLSVLLPYGDQHGTPYFTHDDFLIDDPTAPDAHSQRTSTARRTGASPVLLLFALIVSTIFITQLSVSATTDNVRPPALHPQASTATAPTSLTILPDGSGIPVQADETRAGVADLSVTARTTGTIRSDTLATNARTRGTGPVPSQRSSEHAIRDTLHPQHRIPSAAPLRMLTTTMTTTR